jgi:metal-dependent hydrolase (beta-lactamase superfamily II)
MRLVVNTGSKLPLFDRDMRFRKIYGPRIGHVLANLPAARIDSASIDVVALNHAHPDHVWGLVGEDARVRAALEAARRGAATRAYYALTTLPTATRRIAATCT